jgi:hypothetical protein
MKVNEQRSSNGGISKRITLGVSTVNRAPPYSMIWLDAAAHLPASASLPALNSRATSNIYKKTESKAL